MEDHSHHDDHQAAPVPNLDELLQETPEIPRIPVSVEGATAYRLPPPRSVLSTDTVGDTQWIPVAGPNKKRNRLVLISDTQPIWISRDGRSQGSIWPLGVPYTVEHADSVYVLCATASATTRVGVTAELWAD